MSNKPKVRTIPASSTVVLTDHADSKDHNPNEFDYRHVIGKLLYLEKSTRPDISCAVHQCARHCANPKIFTILLNNLKSVSLLVITVKAT